MTLTTTEEKDHLNTFVTLYYRCTTSSELAEKAFHKNKLDAFIDEMAAKGIPKAEKYFSAIQTIDFDICEHLLNKGFPCSAAYLKGLLGNPNNSARNVRLFMERASPKLLLEVEKLYDNDNWARDFKIVIFIAANNLERYKELLATVNINSTFLEFVRRFTDEKHTNILTELVYALTKKFPHKNELVKKIGLLEFIQLLEQTKRLNLTDAHAALLQNYDKESLEKDRAKAAERIYNRTTDQFKFFELHRRINTLEKYGETLALTQNRIKGHKATSLAKKIRTEVEAYEREYSYISDERKTALSKKLSKIISDGYSEMGEDRNIKDILGHILFALTFAGLGVLLYKKFFTASHSVFLNKTHRQTLVNDISTEFSLSNSKN